MSSMKFSTLNCSSAMGMIQKLADRHAVADGKRKRHYRAHKAVTWRSINSPLYNGVAACRASLDCKEQLSAFPKKTLENIVEPHSIRYISSVLVWVFSIRAARKHG